MQNKYHTCLLNLIQKTAASPMPDFDGFGLKYVGTDKPGYHLNTLQHKQALKDFLRSHQLNPQEFTDLVTSLYQNGQSYDEIILAGRLVGLFKHRSDLDPQILDTWLSYVHGWAETDTLCQMAFEPHDLLSNWTAWKNLLTRFTLDTNIHKRRASLVLLTKPVRRSPDSRLSELAFLNTDRLKSETDILITKAVSWILRSLIVNHRREVSDYIQKNSTTLPKIALREVTSKLNTGKKYVNQKQKQG